MMYIELDFIRESDREIVFGRSRFKIVALSAIGLAGLYFAITLAAHLRTFEDWVWLWVVAVLPVVIPWAGVFYSCLSGDECLVIDLQKRKYLLRKGYRRNRKIVTGSLEDHLASSRS